MRGRIVNDTDQEVSLMYLTVAYYGYDGHIIGICGTNVMDILPNNKTSFDCAGIYLPDQVTLNTVANYTIYANDTYYQW